MILVVLVAEISSLLGFGDARTWYARALFLEGEDLSEAETTLDDVWRRSKRVLGDAYPDTERARKFLEEVRSARAGAAEED